jgi:hypothetical protein
MRTPFLGLLLTVPILILPLTLRTVAAQEVVFQGSVVPLPDEDLAEECRYELTLTNRTKTVQAVWIIFDRGRETCLGTMEIRMSTRLLNGTGGRCCCHFTVAQSLEPMAT